MLTTFSCGSKSTPLDDTQQTELQSTFSSLGRAYAATLGSSAAAQNTAANANPFPYGAFSVDAALATELTSDPALASMAAAINGDACDVEETPLPSTLNDGNEPAPQIYFSLNANDLGSCPIQLSLIIESQQNSGEHYTITAINYAYTASDPNFLALNDVTGIKLNGGISQIDLGTANANVSVQVSGKIASQKLGTIPISVQGLLQAQDSSGTLTGAIVWQFQFPDFLAVFEQDYKQGVVTNSLNNADLSQSDFNAYFLSAGDPFYYISGINQLGLPQD